MQKPICFFILFSLLVLPGCSSLAASEPPQPPRLFNAPLLSSISLPEPVRKGTVSLEECLENRRSIRQYSQSPLALSAVSQLLWATQGITGKGSGRSAPSAGALYPLEVYLAAGKVDGLSAGVYKYRPQEHSLVLVRNKNIIDELSSSALNQPAIKNGAVNMVLCAVYERLKTKYGERSIRYATLEAGHAAQNFCLQAVSLGLAAVTIGAFDDERVKSVTGMENNESPLYILAAGHPQ
jgi:SagB-type dehydrogenase family enzyme